MSSPDLGTLEKVPLRKVWNDEAASFTPWLASPENLKLLSDKLGIDLELEGIEKEVGPYSADILCRDTSDGSWVVIENQIEKTNHGHLGQVLTYAAGLGARTLVWIAAEFTEQHRSVLDWLNENTIDEVSVFGIEVEALRIGNSPPAVRFNVISKPNKWSKSTRSSVSREGVTIHRQLQHEFWTAFHDWLAKNDKKRIRLNRPAYQNWLNSGIGRSGMNLAVVISTWNSITNSEIPEVRVELVLTSEHAKQHFGQLEERKSEIQNLIDAPLTWHNLENSKSCKIYVQKDGEFRQKQNWPELFEWLAKYLSVFRDALGPIVRDL